MAITALMVLFVVGSCTPPPLASTGTVASPEGSRSAGQPALTLWVNETHFDALTGPVRAFSEETGQRVNLVARDGGTMRDDFLKYSQLGTAPDVVMGEHSWLGGLLHAGAISPVPLEEQALYAPVALEAFSHEGQLFGAPFAMDAVALIRNTRLAAHAPTTWDEVRQAHLDSGVAMPFPIQTGSGGDPYTYYSFQTSFGAPVFDRSDDGTYADTLAMGAEPGRLFAQWLAAEGAAGTFDTSVSYHDAVEAFAGGEVPYVVGTEAMLGTLGHVDTAVDAIPPVGPNPAQPFVDVQGFYLSAQTVQVAESADLIQHIMEDPRVHSALASATARIPVYTPALDGLPEDNAISAFHAVARQGVPTPSNSMMAAVWPFWGVTEAQIISGDVADPGDAWDQMVEDIRAAAVAG
ncbi:MAG: extracellular solute-binding protein [Cellulomonadaceae bacterium]|nr:extracellular solute-binding protein [Cellulomonadaceae bacterium]